MTPLNHVWHSPPTDLALSSGEVHVWRASLDPPAARLQQLASTLCADELSRAERFYFQQHRQRFIAGRGLLRTILSCYLGIQPQEVEFHYGPHGKPALAEPRHGNTLRFNLSHSQDLVLYAVTCDREIGIDLEQVRQISEAEQIAESFFSAQEKAVFRALPPSKRQEAFFNCWTRKESFLKAIGDGLARPLKQIDVSLVPGEPAKLLSIAEDSQAAHRWCLQDLTPAAGYVAALAVEGQGWRLSCWQWPE